jgi:type IV secretory pathway VirB10-like protein
MRPKVAFAIAALGLFVLGSLFAIRHSSDRSTRILDPQPTTAGPTQASDSVAAAKSPPVAESPVAAPKDGTQPVASSEEAHKAYVEQRSAQLMEMAMNDDRASLDSILSELGNRDPEIRKAALDATIQFGSRDAIPKLADAASQTDDPNEKTAITDAIEFLKLPSLTEISSHSPKPVANNSNAGSRPAHKGALGKRALPTPPPTQ